jgi:hypothetical protein
MLMKCLSYRPFLGGFLSLLILFDTLPAEAFPDIQAPPFGISLPAHLGQVTDASPDISERRNSHPDYILIQNLHCNRSVQSAISKILNRLERDGILPERIALEGLVGLYDVSAMQQVPDSKARLKAADYLISQGEMNGAMHYVVSQGKGGLYGIETSDLYDSTIETYRRSYAARSRLGDELVTLEAALGRLKAGSPGAPNAAILTEDVQAVRKLIDQRLTPKEVRWTLTKAVYAVDHLESVLPKESAKKLLEPVSAAVDFYALALLRDTALFEHSLELRKMDHQATTVLVAGGFHTPGLTQRLRAQGLSYVVISPTVRRHTAVDEQLYVERMLGHHLTVEQAMSRKDWASEEMVEPPVSQILPGLFFGYLAAVQQAPFDPTQAPQTPHPFQGEPPWYNWAYLIVPLIVIYFALRIWSRSRPLNKADRLKGKEFRTYVKTLEPRYAFPAIARRLGRGGGVLTHDLSVHNNPNLYPKIIDDLLEFLEKLEATGAYFSMRPSPEKLAKDLERNRAYYHDPNWDFSHTYREYLVNDVGLEWDFTKSQYKNLATHELLEAYRKARAIQNVGNDYALAFVPGTLVYHVTDYDNEEGRSEEPFHIEVTRVAKSQTSQAGFSLTEVSHILTAAIAGFAVPQLWHWVVAIPWWGWGSGLFIWWLLWFIFNPVSRFRRAARIEIGGLPKEVKFLVKRFGPAPLMKLVFSDPKNAKSIILYGLPAVIDRIQSIHDLTNYFHDLSIIAQTYQDRAALVFSISLPPLKELINAYGIEPFVAIAQASGENTWPVYYGLIKLKGQIKSLQDLNELARFLLSMATISRGNLFVLVEYGIPKFSDRFASVADAKAYILPLAKIASYSHDLAVYIFYGISLEKGHINNPIELETVGQTWIDLVKKSGDKAKIVFEYGIPKIKDLIRTQGFSHPELLVEKLQKSLASLPSGYAYPIDEHGYSVESANEYTSYHEIPPDPKPREAIYTLMSILSVQKSESSESNTSSESKHQRGIGRLGAVAGLLGAMGVLVVTVPYLLPVLAGVSIWVWGIELTAVGVMAAIYAGLSMYLKFQARNALADANEAKVKSLTIRLGERLSQINLSIPPIKNIFITPPWMKPAVARQVAQVTNALINTGA